MRNITDFCSIMNSITEIAEAMELNTVAEMQNYFKPYNGIDLPHWLEDGTFLDSCQIVAVEDAEDKLIKDALVLIEVDGCKQVILATTYTDREGIDYVDNFPMHVYEWDEI